MVKRTRPELDRISALWQADCESVAVNIGDRLSGTGALLASSCRVIMVDGDFRFDPVPKVKEVDDIVELTCNLDAYEEWQKILGETPDMDEQEVQHLYLGVGVAQAELSLVANASVKESSGLNGRQRMSIGKRAMNVVEKFHSRDDLASHANIFEQEHELWGLEDLVRENLTPGQILRINQLRYGLAVGMHAMDLEPETERGVEDSFANHLKADVEQREQSLYSFLRSFAGEDYDEVTVRQEKIQAYSFPELLFAGTMPMDIIEVIE